MTRKLFPLALALVLLPLSIANAEWYLGERGGKKTKIISEKPYSFLLDDIRCMVSQSDHEKISDDHVLEYRELSCSVSDDTTVSVIVSCNMPSKESRSLRIKKKGKTYSPVLICGPKKLVD